MRLSCFLRSPYFESPSHTVLPNVNRTKAHFLSLPLAIVGLSSMASSGEQSNHVFYLDPQVPLLVSYVVRVFPTLPTHAETPEGTAKFS